jgi:uncharacterized membrane protein
MSLLGNLRVRLTAETADFARGLESARQKLQSFNKDLNRLGRRTQRVGDTLTKFLGLPILAAGAGLLALSKRAADAAEQIDKMAIRSGIARGRLQELKYATDQLGASFETTVGLIEVLTRQVPQIEKGTSDVAKSFARLGINLRGTDGRLRSMATVFPEVLTALSRIGNETERNAIATQLFGRRAFEIVPLLEAGGQEIERLSKRARELGLVMGDEQIKALVAFRDQWNEVRQQMEAVGRDLATALLPVLRDYLLPILQDGLVPALQAFVKAIKSVRPETIAMTAGIAGSIATMSMFVLVVGKLTVAFTGLATALSVGILPLLGVGGAVALGLGALAGLWAKNRVEAAAFRAELNRFKDLDVNDGNAILARKNALEAEGRQLKAQRDNLRRLIESGTYRASSHRDRLADMNTRLNQIGGELGRVNELMREHQTLTLSFDPPKPPPKPTGIFDDLKAEWERLRHSVSLKMIDVTGTEPQRLSLEWDHAQRMLAIDEERLRAEREAGIISAQELRDGLRTLDIRRQIAEARAREYEAAHRHTEQQRAAFARDEILLNDRLERERIFTQAGMFRLSMEGTIAERLQLQLNLVERTYELQRQALINNVTLSELELENELTRLELAREREQLQIRMMARAEEELAAIDRQHAIRSQIAGVITTVGNGNVSGGQVGSLAGSFAGSFVPIIGPAIGSAVGGVLGGLFDRDKEAQEQQINHLQAIERASKATITAIQAQTDQLLSPQNRLINAPAGFSVPSRNPAGASASYSNAYTYEITVNVDAASAPADEVAKSVERTMRDVLARSRSRASVHTSVF